MGGGKPGKYLFWKESHCDQKDDWSKNPGKGEQTKQNYGNIVNFWEQIIPYFVFVRSPNDNDACMVVKDAIMKSEPVEVLQGIGGWGRSWKSPRDFVLSRLCNKRSWRRRSC